MVWAILSSSFLRVLKCRLQNRHKHVRVGVEVNHSHMVRCLPVVSSNPILRQADDNIFSIQTHCKTKRPE